MPARDALRVVRSDVGPRTAQDKQCAEQAVKEPVGNVLGAGPARMRVPSERDHEAPSVSSGAAGWHMPLLGPHRERQSAEERCSICIEHEDTATTATAARRAGRRGTGVRCSALAARCRAGARGTAATHRCGPWPRSWQPPSRPREGSEYPGSAAQTVAGGVAGQPELGRGAADTLRTMAKARSGGKRWSGRARGSRDAWRVAAVLLRQLQRRGAEGRGGVSGRWW
jgi:hypothetical protein